MLPGSTKPRFGWVDALVMGMLAAGVVYVFFQVGTVLNYQWKWSALPRFFIRYDEKTLSWVPNLLLLGLVTTLRLSIWGSVVAVVVGVIVGLARIVPSLTLRLLGGTYVELVRNIPPLVFIFIFYFFLSSQIVPLTGIEPALRHASPQTLFIINFLFGDPKLFTSFVPAAVALGLFAAAYIAEIIRAGIQSIGKGQWDAARAMGLPWRRTMRLVILPQALARIWAPLANEMILLVKFSSLASLVSVPDLTFQANQVGVTTRGMFEVWLVVAAIYLVICFGLASLFGWLEKRSNRFATR